MLPSPLVAEIFWLMTASMPAKIGAPNDVPPAGGQIATRICA